MEEKIFLEFIKNAYETGNLSGYEYENLKEKLEKDNTIIIELEPYSRYEDSI